MMMFIIYNESKKEKVIIFVEYDVDEIYFCSVLEQKVPEFTYYVFRMYFLVTRSLLVILDFNKCDLYHSLFHMMKEKKCNISHVSKECVQYVDEFGTYKDLIRTRKEQEKAKTNERAKIQNKP